MICTKSHLPFLGMQFPQTLALVHPIGADAIYLFYTREFYAYNPNSLTATLFRVLFQEDVKGVLVVLYKTQNVDILAISDANYKKFLPLKSYTIRVLYAYKSAAGEIPGGLADVISALYKCESVEYADEVLSNLTKAITEQLGSKITCKASVPQRMFTIPAYLFPNVKQAAYDAYRHFATTAEALCKKAPRIVTDKLVAGLEVAEKSQQFITYHATNMAFSITTAVYEGTLYRGINSLRAGFSNVSEMKDQKFYAIQITVSSRGFLNLSIGRMIFICKEENRRELAEKVDQVCKMHEQCLACVKDGTGFDTVWNQMKEVYKSSSLKVVERLTNMAIAGYSQAGICCKEQLQQNVVEMVLKPDAGYIFDANTPILLRSSALLELNGNQFICTFCDVVMPSYTTVVSEKSLTSPIGTKASVSEFLREYYTIKEIASTQKQIVPQTSYQYAKYQQGGESYFSLKNTHVDSSDDESSKEVDILAQRRANQMKKRMLLDRHAELKELVIYDMQRRLPTQKLICDDEDAQEIYIAYREVEDMPHGLYFSKNTFVAGEKMFFFINGRPVPFLPNFFHSVYVSGDDKKVIKIKFIAPGQIIGRKEQHVYLEYYRDYSYIKELTLETYNYAVASKIIERLDKIKVYTDNARKSEAADVYSYPEFDCDNLIQPQMKEFLVQQEEYKALRNAQLQCQVGSSTISQPLEMRPKIKMVQAGTGKRDQGDLSLCENGVKYRYAAAGQYAIELFMPFRRTRRIFYEKFRDNQHICVVSFMFYKPVRIEECLIDKNMVKYIQKDSNFYERFTFLCSMETYLQLGMGRERDEMIQEYETRAQMKKSNIKFDEFFGKLDYYVTDWCKFVISEQRDSDYMLENPRPYICQLSKRSKQLSFLGSVEYKGQQSVYSYEPGCIGVFNGKVYRSLDMTDVQIAVFENVNYSTHNAFYIAFVFKDIRVEPYVIRYVYFDNITAIYEFLTMNNVYYIEIQDSFLWAEAKKRFNASREEYQQFVEMGGWIFEMGDMDETESYTSYDADAYEDESSGYDDSNSASYSDSAVVSESVKESEGDYSVYDWSRSDS